MRGNVQFFSLPNICDKASHFCPDSPTIVGMSLHKSCFEVACELFDDAVNVRVQLTDKWNDLRSEFRHNLADTLSGFEEVRYPKGRSRHKLIQKPVNKRTDWFHEIVNKPASIGTRIRMKNREIHVKPVGYAIPLNPRFKTGIEVVQTGMKRGD